MFTKDEISALHGRAHESLDCLRTPAEAHLNSCLPRRSQGWVRPRRFWLCATILAGASIVIGAPQSKAGGAPDKPSLQAAAQEAPKTVEGLEGTWVGTLQAGDASLHLVLHISRGAGGTLKASLDSLDQGVYGIEASYVRQSPTGFSFDVASVNAFYEGKASSDRHTIEGTWSQGGASLPLVFQRQALSASAKKPSGAVATSEGTWQGALETNGMRFRLLGVGISELVDARADALDLADPKSLKRAKAERAADKARDKFGDDAVMTGRGARIQNEREKG